ncbi:hypothetical protein [Clostridium transplantifaecale]|uniref:hypothetical protein n=1 Tax=Clostridium transplantifaecale TaxID=2479838 RepID=UPI0013DE5C7F|nr:hypothetical protein [Clostridium transplantifaecale]
MKIVIEEKAKPTGEDAQKRQMAEYMSFCRAVFEAKQKFLQESGSDRSKTNGDD